MSVSSLGLFFIVVFITCITPGAGVLYTLKQAQRAILIKKSNRTLINF